MTYVPGQIFPYTFLHQAIFQDDRLKCLGARYLINRWMDRIQILYADSLDISDDLLNFWEEFINTKMANRDFEKIAAQKACGRDILWTVVWITFTFDVGVRWVFLMI